jgi:hypothetical protein
LAYPDPDHEFILDTDASGHSISGVLGQEIDGLEHVIAYGSRTLSKAERNYSVTHRKLLAVVFFIKHFSHYPIGKEFLLWTDHGSLRWLFNFKQPVGQVARWLEFLGAYRFRIVHRPGVKHLNADSLSRYPLEEEVETNVLNGDCASGGSVENCGSACEIDMFDLVQSRDSPVSRNLLVQSSIGGSPVGCGKQDLLPAERIGSNLVHLITLDDAAHLEMLEMQRNDPDLKIVRGWLDNRQRVDLRICCNCNLRYVDGGQCLTSWRFRMIWSISNGNLRIKITLCIGLWCRRH